MRHGLMSPLFKRAALLACTALLASHAVASSPAAWSAHDKEVASSCVKASTLKNAQPAGQPMAYDDRAGMTVLLISGRYPQAHMKNRAGRELCLFDRKTRAAYVIEADQINAVKSATK